MHIVKLMVMSGVNDGLEVVLDSHRKMGRATENGWTFSIGRAENCDLAILYDTQVSRTHAYLHLHADGLWLEDAGSRNGCIVEDQRIRQPVSLGLGQMFCVGRTWLRVQDIAL